MKLPLSSNKRLFRYKQCLFFFIAIIIFSKFCFAVPPEEIIPFEQLDYLRIDPPSYPHVAQKNGWEGTVVVKTLVEKDGSCAQAAVEKSSGFAVLDEAALQAVKKWEFSPARMGQTPYPALARIPVRFVLAGRK